MVKYDIPVNISVVNTNEHKGEQAVLAFLKAAFKEFGNEFGIADYEYFEFVAEESGCLGCGDNNKQQGEHIRRDKPTSVCSGKGGCC